MLTTLCFSKPKFNASVFKSNVIETYSLCNINKSVQRRTNKVWFSALETSSLYLMQYLLTLLLSDILQFFNTLPACPVEINAPITHMDSSTVTSDQQQLTENGHFIHLPIALTLFYLWKSSITTVGQFLPTKRLCLTVSTKIGLMEICKSCRKIYFWNLAPQLID